MKIQVFKPKEPAVKGFVELYLAIESTEYIELKTIPNGRVDASLVLEGELEWFFKEGKKFERLSRGTLFPLTRTIGKACSRGYTRCIGVKFYPHILVLPMFDNIQMKEPLGFDQIFGTPSLDDRLFKDLKSANDLESQALLLDTYFLKQLFSHAPSDDWIQEVTSALESGSSTQVKIRKIADDMGISIKTLERRFRKIIGLTPKLFSTIIQLHQTTHSIRKKNPTVSHGDLTDALGNGYYDQSHFIKSCRKITGLTPKKLFTHLPTPMTDLVVMGNQI